MKAMTVVGTGPEIIRLARGDRPDRKDRRERTRRRLSGPNLEYLLNETFFSDLDLRASTDYFEVETNSMGATLAGISMGIEKGLVEEKLEALLVLGDTNVCVAAVMAKRMKIPTYHMEAGNRCFGEDVPEETNRQLVDHVAGFNPTYTEHARRNLLSEGLRRRHEIVMGLLMREVLEAFRDQIDSSNALSRRNLNAGGHFLVSAHREENVDNPERVRKLLDCLMAVRDQWEKRLIESSHPSTRERLRVLDSDRNVSNIKFMEPFGFHDYKKLQLKVGDVIPAVGIAMVDRLVASTYTRCYEVRDTSNCVVRFIYSTDGRYNQWAGIRG